MKVHRTGARQAEQRAKKLILPTLGRVRLSDLTAQQLAHWRDTLAEQPALKRTALGAPQAYREPPATPAAKRARRASVNRVLILLRAALNAAWRAGHVNDDSPWRKVKPFSQTAAARPGYLSIEEAVRLINAADPDFRLLVRGALETGARYGELIALRCGDYQREKVHVAKSKSGKTRDIILSQQGAAFFDSITAGRGRNETMFRRADGLPWKPSQQARPMRDACDRAHIVPPVSFHSLRHTWASLAVMGGMPLLLVARNLGHGDTTMVQHYYGHLAVDYTDTMIRDHAPVYGLVQSGNVRRLR
jgi:integrase